MPSTASSVVSSSHSTSHYLDSTSLYTKSRPRTAISTLGGGDQQIVCAISESRGVSPTVGLAFVNLSTAEIVLSQIADSQTYIRTIHKLHVFDPSEILVAHTATGNNKSKLLKIVEANIQFDASIRAISRKYWDEAHGSDCISQLAFKDDIEAIKVSVGGNFFAITSLAACLKYVELELGIFFAPHSIRMRYEPSEGSILIDLPTIHSLELIQNIRDSKSKECLFGMLNQCVTPMGSRLLRCNILQPPTDETILRLRYDAVEELASDEASFVSIRQALKAFLDVDRVITEIVVIPMKPTLQRWEQSINNVILLRQYIRSIPTLFEALQPLASELLQRVRVVCDPTSFTAVSELIDTTINDDITYQKKSIDLRHQRTYAVRSGQNGLLDIARQSYKEANDDVVALCENLKEAHQLKLNLKYDPGRHYYFVMPKADIEDRELPAIFVNAVRRKNMIECQTLDLMKLNQKITDAHDEVLQMSDKTIQQLLEEIRQNVGPLVKISESIATIDMLAAFAQVATAQDYCKPVLGQTMAIKDGRHPLHETLHKNKYIPNDVYASQQSRFQIITGCNMSGKSTYIRSVALMTIMAQIGSFVPASYASMIIRHELFARLSLDDSSISNISTFAAEMREMAFILKNITPKSLVVIDELGRGTSTRDGLAIAIAIAEDLIDSRALIWFVTHFGDLAKFLKERPGVLNLHLAVRIDETNSSMKMLYRIAQGPVRDERYGIALAKVVGLPVEIINVAEKISIDITAKKESHRSTSVTVIRARKRKLLLGLREHMLQLQERGLERDDLKQYLIDLRREFILRMSELEEEESKAFQGQQTATEESASRASEVEDTDAVAETSESVFEKGSMASGPSYAMAGAL